MNKSTQIQNLIQQRMSSANKIIDGSDKIRDEFKPVFKQKINENIRGIKSVSNANIMQKNTQMYQRIENDFKLTLGYNANINELEQNKIAILSNNIDDKKNKMQALNQAEMSKVDKAIKQYNIKNNANFKFSANALFLLPQKNDEDLTYIEKLEILCSIVSKFTGEPNELEEYIKNTFELYVDFVKKCKNFHQGHPNIQNLILHEIKHIKPFFNVENNSCVISRQESNNKTPILQNYIDKMFAFAGLPNKENNLSLYKQSANQQQNWIFDINQFEANKQKLCDDVAYFNTKKIDKITDAEIDDIRNFAILSGDDRSEAYPQFLKNIENIENKVLMLLKRTAQKDEKHFADKHLKFVEQIFTDKTNQFDYSTIYNNPNLTDDQKDVELEKQNNIFYQEAFNEALEQYNPSEEFHKHNILMKKVSAKGMPNFFKSMRLLYPKDYQGYVSHILELYEYVLQNPNNVIDFEQSGGLKISVNPYFASKFNDIERKDNEQFFISTDISDKISKEYLDSISDNDLDEVLNNLNTLNNEQLNTLLANCDAIINEFTPIKQEYNASNDKKFLKLRNLHTQKTDLEAQLKGSVGEILPLKTQLQQIDAQIVNPAYQNIILQLKTDKQNLQARIEQIKNKINNKLQKVLQKLKFDKNEITLQRILRKERKLEKIKKRAILHQLSQDKKNQFKQLAKVSDNNKVFEMLCATKQLTNPNILKMDLIPSSAANNVMKLIYASPVQQRNDSVVEINKNDSQKFINPLEKDKKDKDAVVEISRKEKKRKEIANGLYLGLAALGGLCVGIGMFLTLSPILLLSFFSILLPIAAIVALISSFKKNDSGLWNMVFVGSMITMSVLLPVILVVLNVSLPIVFATVLIAPILFAAVRVAFLNTEKNEAKKLQEGKDIVAMIPFYGLYKSFSERKEFESRPQSTEYQKANSRFFISLGSTIAIFLAILLISLFVFVRLNPIIDFNFKLLYAAGLVLGYGAVGVKSAMTILGISTKIRNKTLEMALQEEITPKMRDELNNEVKQVIEKCGYINHNAITKMQNAHSITQSLFININQIYLKAGFSPVPPPDTPARKISKFRVVDDEIRDTQIQLSLQYAEKQINKSFTFKQDAKDKDLEKEENKKNALKKYYQMLYFLQLSMPKAQAFQLMKKYSEYASDNPKNVPGMLNATQINYENAAEFLLLHNTIKYIENIINPNQDGIDTPDIILHDADVQLTERKSLRESGVKISDMFGSNGLASFTMLMAIGIAISMFFSPVMVVVLSSLLAIFGIAGIASKIGGKDHIQNANEQRAGEIVGAVLKIASTVITTVFTLAQFNVISLPVIAALGPYAFIPMAIIGAFLAIFMITDYIKDIREHKNDKIVDINSHIAENIKNTKDQKADIQLDQNIKLEFNELNSHKKNTEEQNKDDLTQEAKDIASICNALNANTKTTFIEYKEKQHKYRPHQAKAGFEAVYPEIDYDKMNLELTKSKRQKQANQRLNKDNRDLSEGILNKSFSSSQNLLQDNQILQSVEKQLQQNHDQDQNQGLSR